MRGHEATRLWHALFGPQPGYIGVHSALRQASGARRLVHHRFAFFEYPYRSGAAADWCLRGSEAGLEAYFCAHLLTGRRRTKANAAPVTALWADADGARVPPEAPEPTAVVESSPGRAHLFWRLRSSVRPPKAEEFNRRLLRVIGADRSGWDLTQLLRPPGTRNRKYEEAPDVRLLELDEGASYHPRELELALPLTENHSPQRCAGTPARCPGAACLSRLSARMRAIISRGNVGAGSPYRSRSEADFAACLAMFGAGFEEPEVWAVMTDPSNGISEKYREKGRHGDAYLSLTIRKARALALRVA